MKTASFIVVLLGLVSINAFADAQGEVCQGTSSNGGNFTITVNNANDEISVNALGKRVSYDVYDVGGGDDYYRYESTNGELSVTFYDQGSSCSGFSKELGKFKGNVRN